MRRANCRQRLALGAAAVLLLVPLAWGQGENPAPKGPKMDPALAKQVNAAIDQGVKYLRGLQQADGSWPRQERMGMTAFAALALLEGGVAANDPAITRAADFVRLHCPIETGVYAITTAILFLDRLGDPQDVPLIQALGVRLLAAQTRGVDPGGWGYHSAPPGEAEAKWMQAVVQNRKPGAAPAVPAKGEEPKRLTPKDLPKELRDQVARINRAGGFTDKLGVDLSNTQFALLALWVARRHGVPVDTAFALADARLRRTQSANGTWSYVLVGNVRGLLPSDGNFVHPTAQMTCAGLMGLAMSHGITESVKRPKFEMSKDPNIRKGLLAVVPTVGAPTGDLSRVPRIAPGRLQQAYYALWTLERVAMLFQLPDIGGKDWYRWGAEILVANQQANGSWKGAYEDGGADTCFALLFLKRTNFADDLTQKIRKDPRRIELLEGITEGSKTKSDLKAPAPKPGPPGGKQSWAPPAEGPALRGPRPAVAGRLHRLTEGRRQEFPCLS
jgi:hypothetical protein